MVTRPAGLGMCFALVSFLLGLPSAALRAQTSPPLRLDTGKDIYEAACVSCHGVDGRGAPLTSVGFETRLPDFTDCAFATREPDADWSAITHNGGPARGFSEIMPAYRDALSDEQIDQAIAHMRGFCREKAWPRGELNLPRALVTEKAFPEDEAVLTSAITTAGTPARGNALVLERRIGPSGQVEAVIPYDFVRAAGAWVSGFGDIVLGYKQKLFHSLRTGSIFSVAGEFVGPTGDPSKGTGGETAVFETFAAYGQLLPADGFLQFQLGMELPAHTDRAPKAWFARTVIGRGFSTDGGLGRTWSPMIELLADRDLESGAHTNWDVVPELQIPLSKRMHILGNVGVRIPVNDTAGRSTRLMLYLLWDFADGSLRQGW